MKMRIAVPSALAVLALASTLALAQEPAPPAPAPPPARPPATLAKPAEPAQPEAPPEPAAATRRAPRPAPVPLKVQVTISRSEGDKKTLSLPYTLLVNAPERDWGERTSLRMGIDVPIRTGAMGPDKDGKPAPSYQYRNIGTRIDCRASRFEDRYQLETTVEQSSLNNPSERASFGNPDVPIMRSFNTSFSASLRDGQTVTTVVAADPVSGESVRIEVSATAAR
jgi:hypothetical protein